MLRNPRRKNIMKHWNKKTGEYISQFTLWDNFGKNTEVSESGEALEELEEPDVWLSKPGGEYYIGISFHYPPYNFAQGKGVFENRYIYQPAPFLLHTQQDSYNSWGVTARLEKYSPAGTMEYWDWYPGIMVIDTSKRFSLPSEMLAHFAGTEWAENDFRVFHGLHTDEAYTQLTTSALKVIKRITGPGWASWPFGVRQLAEAVLFWVSPEGDIPELLLQASVKQHGVKHAYIRDDLYNPGDWLGAWEEKVESWDCRQSLKFLYQAKLLLKDGLPEMALSCAIASLENASAEILSFLVNGNHGIVEQELNNVRFLDRFDEVLPKFKAAIPQSLFAKLKKAYFARNGIVHGLRPITYEQASDHLATVEEVLKWYWLHVGSGNQINKANLEKNAPPF